MGSEEYGTSRYRRAGIAVGENRSDILYKQNKLGGKRRCYLWESIKLSTDGLNAFSVANGIMEDSVLGVDVIGAL